MKRLTITLLASLLGGTATAADWDGIPVPADPGAGMVWELHPLSDDFNYEAPAAGKSAAFYERWKEGFINPWTGPGLTEWHPEYSLVSNGRLQIKSGRKPGTNQVYLGSITSKTTLTYPLYMEARAKLSNMVLASDFWLLSADSTEEIDVIEAYGSDRPGQEWFAERLHLSHHVFIREPFQDYQPTDPGTWYADGNGTRWADGYHRVGVYWRDPWHLEYYVDGQLVRTASGPDIIDPNGFTNGTGLSKPMHAIINMEDQSWRSDNGITPTDAELADPNRNTYNVDWVRFYKPVATGGGSGSGGSGSGGSSGGSSGGGSTEGDVTTVELGDFYSTGKDGASVSGDTVPGFNRNGSNINYNTSGDWGDYTVTLPEAGDYRVELITASPSAGELGAELQFNGSTLVTTLGNTGGWESYQTFQFAQTVSVSAAGDYGFRVKSIGTSAWQWNGDAIRFVKQSSQRPAESITLELSDFVTTGKVGSAVAGDSVVGFNPNGSNINYNTSGDWAEYQLDVATSGNYGLILAAATPMSGDINAQVSIDGQNVGTIAISNTGDWESYVNFTLPSPIALPPGTHTLRVQSTGNSAWQWNGDKVVLTPVN